MKSFLNEQDRSDASACKLKSHAKGIVCSVPKYCAIALESLIAPLSSKSRPMDLGKAVGDTSHAAPLTESAIHAFTASESPKVYLR